MSMNIYENAATEAIRSFFDNEPRWKNEILFNFLLEPFNLKLDDIKKIETQNYLKGTIPDFTVKTKNHGDLKFEVKINNVGLTSSEKGEKNRDAFLIRKNYIHIKDIRPTCKILYWEDLFERIDKKGAMTEFARLALIREYMKEPENTLLLSQMEVAMLYSPDIIYSVYTMSNKILALCNNFLDSNSIKQKYKKREKDSEQKDENGVGYYFDTKDGKYELFIGLSPAVPQEYYFSIALSLDGKNENEIKKYKYTDGDYAFFSLDKEILAKYSSEKDLQEAFNKNAEDKLKEIFSTKK